MIRIALRASLLAAASVAVLAGPVLAQTSQPQEARVMQILKRTPLIDGHNDLPWALRQGFGNDPHGVDLNANLSTSTRLHTDIPRLRAGGVGGQFWSVYVPASMAPVDAAKATFEQIDTVKRIVAAHPETFEIATTADDLVRIHRAGKIASLIGMEGGYSIDDSLGLLREFYDSGARYMTLTHSKSTTWADSGTDAPKWDGLNAFGEDVVREMNRLGMMVDLSHVSEATMVDAIRVSEAPVIFSHSSARAVTAHPRRRAAPDGGQRRHRHGDLRAGLRQRGRAGFGRRARRGDDAADGPQSRRSRCGQGGHGRLERRQSGAQGDDGGRHRPHPARPRRGGDRPRGPGRRL